MKVLDKPLFLFIAIIVCVSGWSSLALSADDNKGVLPKFYSAASHYRDGKFIDAISDYESIINEHVASGNIYYNLANSYYRAGDVGRAILNYERAKRLIPRDGDLNYNFHFVRSRIQSADKGGAENLIRRLLREHAEFYTREEMVLLMTGVVFLWIMADILSKLVFRQGDVLRWIKAVMGIIFIVYLIGFVFKVEYEKDQAIIVGQSSARFEPRSEATVHFHLAPGERVRIVREESGWYKIRRLDGKLGWIRADKIESI